MCVQFHPKYDQRCPKEKECLYLATFLAKTGAQQAAPAFAIRRAEQLWHSHCQTRRPI
jgi:hypothetical protein